MTNITKITSFFMNASNFTVEGGAALSLATETQELFLGSVYSESGGAPSYLSSTMPAGIPPFSEIPVHSYQQQIIWGDVLKGIEEMSHNVTAGLLTLPLGTMNSTCFLYQKDVPAYRYSSFQLWVPYGVSTSLYSHVSIPPFPYYVLQTALGVALISLVFAVMIMARIKTGQLTTSFSDTAILTRNVDEEVSVGAKLRLRAAKNGKLEYIFE